MLAAGLARITVKSAHELRALALDSGFLSSSPEEEANYGGRKCRLESQDDQENDSTFLGLSFLFVYKPGVRPPSSSPAHWTVNLR